MNFSLKQALKVLVVFACAVGVVGTSVMITNKNTDNAKNKNDSLWNVVDGSDSDSDDSSTPTSGPNGEPLAPKNIPLDGNYIDIDGDGTVDGIIFADLLFGGNGYWDNVENNIMYSSYSINTISSCKEYYQSQNYYNNGYTSGQVYTPIGKGNDRFYVMALEDIDSNVYSWYNTASDINDYNIVTSEDFGSGRQNTLNMLEKWNNNVYREQTQNDAWEAIQNKVNEGWFVPSRAEWAAFGAKLRLTDSNYSRMGLSDTYWTSSMQASSQAYDIEFNRQQHYKILFHRDISEQKHVRLAKTV